MPEFHAVFLEKTKLFIEALNSKEQARIKAHVDAMEDGGFESVYSKPLRGAIRELIVPPYRLVYFIVKQTIYFVSVFRKKSAKTSLREIEQVVKIYRIIKNN